VELVLRRLENTWEVVELYLLVLQSQILISDLLFVIPIAIHTTVTLTTTLIIVVTPITLLLLLVIITNAIGTIHMHVDTIRMIVDMMIIIEEILIHHPVVAVIIWMLMDEETLHHIHHVILIRQKQKRPIQDDDDNGEMNERKMSRETLYFFLIAFSAAFVTFPDFPSVFSTDLMTPTATVCLMSRTAKRPRGGYSL